MTTSDWISLAQTIILFLTGLIVFWYTCETQKLRKTNSHQAELLQEQVLLMRQTFEHDKAEQWRTSRPFIRWDTASRGDNIKNAVFYNEGGPISYIRIQTVAPIESTLNPDALIATGQSGNVSFSTMGGRSQLPDEFAFQIKYRTRLGDEETKFFKTTRDGTPVEI